MDNRRTKGCSYLKLVSSVFQKPFDCFVQKYRRVVVKNKVAHIVEIILKIKKGIWKKHPSIESHAHLIVETCTMFTPGCVDMYSREIVCAACLFIDECLGEDVLEETRRSARKIFEIFSCHDNHAITSEDLRSKFTHWFSL